MNFDTTTTVLAIEAEAVADYRAQHSYPEDDVAEAVNAERRRIAEEVKARPTGFVPAEHIVGDLHDDAIAYGRDTIIQVVDYSEILDILERRP